MVQSKLASEHPWAFAEGDALTEGLVPNAVGGAAEVFSSTLFGRRVAIKIALLEGGALTREAEVLALARSPRAPALRGCGWAKSDGARFVATRSPIGARPFIVVDWYDDQPLKEGAHAALLLARDIAGALADAHAVGIAHGDVKRANIAVAANGRATLLDWGLSSSVFEREPRGATLRYLATDDRDLGDARARDLLALGVLIAEECDPEVRRSVDPIARARRAKLASPLDAFTAALSTESPNARPSARWAEETAREALGAVDPDEVIARRIHRVRVTYLHARSESLRGIAPDDAAPWLAPASGWLESIDILQLGITDAIASRYTKPLPLLDGDGVSRWLCALSGPHAAAWPVGAITEVGERRIAEGLLELARHSEPSAWSFRQVELAVLGGAEGAYPALHEAGPFEVYARLSLQLGEVPPSMGAMEAVERDLDAPPSLVLQAANALRSSSELGRARALTLRETFARAPGASGLAGDILRRAGDTRGAAATATAHLHEDADGRAHAVLGRLAFDDGDTKHALALVRDQPGAACAEVAALAHAASGDVVAALEALKRGDSYARSAEDRARLSGARGYILAGIDSAEALKDFRSATNHAVQAGLVVEEATYRTGDAAASVDEGFLADALHTGSRAALLWEALGRPGQAARALLATAAAYATLGLAPEARHAAKRASDLGRQAGDLRAEAYAWLAVADSEVPESEPGARAAEMASKLLAGPHATDDVLHIEARRLVHAPGSLSDLDIARIDRLAEGATVMASARLSWWGARARRILADAPSTHPRSTDGLLAALVGLADVSAPLWARGPALFAGARLAVLLGRSDVAERLRPAVREAARTLVSRVGPDLAAKAADLDWVVSNLDNNSISMDAEQARDLEQLVRTLGSGERLGDLLRRVLDALVLWTGVERGLLLLKAPDGRLLPRAARNFARADLHGEQAALSQTLARRAIDAMSPVVAVDAAHELSDVHRSVHALRLRSVLAVPLLARGEAVGVAYLDDRIRRGAFGPREIAWARTIAALASSMIADARDQVLLRRAVRNARRSNERLVEALADREAKLSAAEKSLERTVSGRGSRYREIVGESEPMVSLLRTIDRVAASDVPVLIMGESGSGKELVARAIHGNGARASHPFVSENCGAIPEGLLESALFGHVRGAFTGADRPRVGLFEAADGGTLFLDEVGEMSLAMQTKLLRVLEDGMVRPLGTERARKVSVRIITATHRNLEELVKGRQFREDLFYRLNIINLRVPPLRERASDIPLLVKRLLEKHARGRVVEVSRAAMARLSSFAWPGNVRQLENEIRRPLVLSDDVIDRAHLSPDIDGGASGAVAEAGLNVRRRVDLLEATLVRDALERTRGNQTQAAKLLGLSRFGLQKMMKRLDITLA